MLIDTLDSAITRHHRRPRARFRRVVGWLLSLVPIAPRRLPINDLSDRDLADLHLRRDEIVSVDPREMRLF